MNSNRTWILALDAGTTGIRAILFDSNLREQRSAYSEFRQFYPQAGWVEHDAAEIRLIAFKLLRRVVASIPLHQIKALGITNQRETIVAWDAKTLEPLHRAIVWQCRRTTDLCQSLRRQGHEKDIRKKTGLYLDPYFSGSKIRWLMENVSAVRRAAEKGSLRWGTIDSWLVASLSKGKSHVTDPSNASRTLLYDIEKQEWDASLCRLFKTRQEFFPEVRDSAADFGNVDVSVLGREIPITGIAGDQQAALYGQGCWRDGQSKITYGTGCFWVLNLGNRRQDVSGFLSTLAADRYGKTCFALEGSVFIGGAVIQWLRDSLQVLKNSGESEKIARSIAHTSGVFFVPAFVGLGAPHWDPEARGAILGLTRGTGRAEIVRAALESIAYQNAEMISLVREKGIRLSGIRVDGGASRNDFLMQFQSDLLGLPLTRAKNLESTALGAAALAAVGAGILSDPGKASVFTQFSGRFVPRFSKSQREAQLKSWRAAVQRILSSKSTLV